MKHHRQLAAALACALAIGLGAGAVLATETAQPATPPLLIAPAPSTAPSASTDTAAEKTDQPVADADVAETAKTPAPDPEGTLSFANLEQRVREGSLDCLILEEGIAYAEATDYEELKEDLRDQLNGLAEAQWDAITMGSSVLEGLAMSNPALFGELTTADKFILSSSLSMSGSAASQSLGQVYSAYEEQYEKLKNGELQEEAADGIRQMRYTQNLIVMGAETLYVQLSEVLSSLDALDRGLAAVDRGLQELELRYEMGQVSALTLQQNQATRTNLLSQRDTLANTARTVTRNLQSMIGEEMTGTLQLSGIPQVTQDQLAAMDLEKDMAAAKELSFDLYTAKKALDDAEETYKDSGAKYGYNEKKYEHVQANHSWQAAQYTYENAHRSFELSFRTLYDQVKDYQQVLTAAETALAVEQNNYAADQVKYAQGTISKNILLIAEDELNTAQNTVATAQRNLFISYNNYLFAVERGILN